MDKIKLDIDLGALKKIQKMNIQAFKGIVPAGMKGISESLSVISKVSNDAFDMQRNFSEISFAFSDLKNSITHIDLGVIESWKGVTESMSELSGILDFNVSTYLNGIKMEGFAYSIKGLKGVIRPIKTWNGVYLKGFADWRKNFYENNRYYFDRFLFLNIADEIGFPLYLEIDTELQNRLIACYRDNHNQCDKNKMTDIILDYYNDDYINGIMQRIKNINVFNQERVELIEEGMDVYQSGHYASSGALFSVELSGMIRDVYEEMNKFQSLTNREKKELLDMFNQNCKINSEKGMLLQILCCQYKGIIIWNKVSNYFLNVTYSTKDLDNYEYPQRHMICHGIQTNYNKKETVLKLIICMDIISELAWRVKEILEEEMIVAEM